MKKIHRFLITEIPQSKEIELTNSEIVHHIKNVLKLKTDEKCIIFANGTDDYICKIKESNKQGLTLSIENTVSKKNIPKNVTACISIVKRDNFELIVQKLTEVGVKKIIPIISDRTIKQSLKIERLQKISDEALEQSGCSDRVHIYEPQNLENALELNMGSFQYYLDIEGKENFKKDLNNICFYIGPEGGWSDEDKELFKKYNAPSCKLGETVLRAETAAIIAGYNLIWQ